VSQPFGMPEQNSPRSLYSIVPNFFYSVLLIMYGDFSLYGVFIPTLLGLMLAAFVLQNGLRVLLLKAGMYRNIWHPPLFNLALYILVLGGLFTLMHEVIA
jgi:hypothetical protein